MDDNLFFTNFDPLTEEQEKFILSVKNITNNNINPVYVLNKPIIDRTVEYSYCDGCALFTPCSKIIFINFGNEDSNFDEYVEDFIDDIGYIAKKYGFVGLLGRTREWSKEFVTTKKFDENFNIEVELRDNLIENRQLIRKGEIIISLATGSINDAERIGKDFPANVLDTIKKKIILFDGEQTKFIFDEPKQKRITIQGLAGTGKTELLLHKIKELYVNDSNSRIVFTCHNRILAANLKKRVPDFFDFMKVEEQIKWNKRLWVMRSWGSESSYESGVYSYICHYYKIKFLSFTYNTSFDDVCKVALTSLESIKNFKCCFDYVLIDEGQDFSDSFVKLCEKVAEKCVYVACDIFQDIFEDKSLSVIKPDFLLNRCYRTDPRTLMGAHAIGMGLFEKKLRWLDDNEWIACGYEIQRNDKFELRRKPLKRFENVGFNISKGIVIIQEKNDNYINAVLNVIDELKTEHLTLYADDIGIVFMENMVENYKLAGQIQIAVKEKYNWDTNIGYETKEKKEQSLFVSNRNNVKGLEFPFVICIMQNQLGNNFSTRNSIYMMLTRSFVTSYLIYPTGVEITNLINGIEFVNENSYLRIDEPTSNEKIQLKNAIINRSNVHKSQYDIIDEILNEIGVMDLLRRKKLHEMVKNGLSNETDFDKLYEFIELNNRLIN